MQVIRKWLARQWLGMLFVFLISMVVRIVFDLIWHSWSRLPEDLAHSAIWALVLGSSSLVRRTHDMRTQPEPEV